MFKFKHIIPLILTLLIPFTANADKVIVPGGISSIAPSLTGPATITSGTPFGTILTLKDNTDSSASNYFTYGPAFPGTVSPEELMIHNNVSGENVFGVQNDNC